MPWQEVSIMSQRCEFVKLASLQQISFRELCRRFAISAPTGYKWLERSRDQGPDLSDRPRRPRTSPQKTSEALEAQVVALRTRHRTWGGRKIAARLTAKGFEQVPAPSTITDILRRHDLLGEDQAQKHRPYLRFERPAPNDLWQMEFKGNFAVSDGRCHPLTILDDHSRYSIAVRACRNEKSATVQAQLIECFRRYGLPKQMLMDNGGPWSSPVRGLTVLEAWLMRLDIGISHGRPHHPQTQGKEERFHRTLKADVLQFDAPCDFAGCQPAFDAFRTLYNHERPHEALGMQPPASRYAPSPRSYPETLPPIQYAPGDHICKVSFNRVRFRGQVIVVGEGVVGQYVALRPTLEDGVYDVIYCNTTIRQINLRERPKSP